MIVHQPTGGAADVRPEGAGQRPCARVAVEGPVPEPPGTRVASHLGIGFRRPFQRARCIALEEIDQLNLEGAGVLKLEGFDDSLGGAAVPAACVGKQEQGSRPIRHPRSTSPPRRTVAFMRWETSRRVSSTRRPHPRHFNPMSAPRRTTTHSLLPHGCGLRSRSTSSIRRSGSIDADYTIRPDGIIRTSCWVFRSPLSLPGRSSC